METIVRLKWKTGATDRDMNYYRSKRDKRLFGVFKGECGMLKRTSWAILPASIN